MKSVLAISSVLLLTACQSLQSSGLIYGTKRVVGIGIEKDASGNPIPGFNLGYVSHDFARVPVAVALDDGPIEIIWGASCDGEPMHCMAFGKHERVLVARVGRIAGVTGKTVPEVVRALSAKLNLLARTDSVAFFEAPEDMDDEDALVQARTAVGTALNGLGVTDADIAAEAAANMTIRSSGDLARRDAFSVFGSFDTRAKSAEASIGQVFATGVAAQIVAGDLANAKRAESVRRCIETANGAEAAQKADAMKACLAAAGSD